VKKTIFVDTAAWIALLNKDDDLHLKAVVLHQRFMTQEYKLITTDYILTELANGMSKIYMRRSAIELIERIRTSNRCEVIHVDERLFEKGWEMYKTYYDKEWSLTDCVSFIIMRERGVKRAFSPDYHFEQAGFTRLLK